MESNESVASESTTSESVESGETTSEESTEAVDQAIAELYEVTVNGEKSEVDMATLIRDYQTGRASQDKFREASDIRKKAETSLASIKDNPWEALAEMGFNPMDLSTSYLEEQLKLQEMSEDERDEHTAKSEFQKQKDAFEKDRAEFEAKKLAEAQTEEESYYEGVIDKAIDDYNLPKSPRTTRRMAELMLNNIEAGFELPVEHIAEMVKEDYIEEMKDIFGGASGDQILSLLGGDLSNKIRKTDLAKLKKGETVKTEKKEESDGEENPYKKRKGESTAAFFARMRE